MFQALFQTGGIVGPALAGLLLAGAGARAVYWIDVVSYLVALASVLAISRSRPRGRGGRGACGPAGGRRWRGCGSSGGPSLCRALT